MQKSLLIKLLCENPHRNIQAASRLMLYGYVPVSSRIHALLLVVQRVVFSTLNRALWAPLAQRDREKEVSLGHRGPVALRQSMGLISHVGWPNFEFSRNHSKVSNMPHFSKFFKNKTKN